MKVLDEKIEEDGEMEKVMMKKKQGKKNEKKNKKKNNKIQKNKEVEEEENDDDDEEEEEEDVSVLWQSKQAGRQACKVCLRPDDVINIFGGKLQIMFEGGGARRSKSGKEWKNLPEISKKKPKVDLIKDRWRMDRWWEWWMEGGYEWLEDEYWLVVVFASKKFQWWRCFVHGMFCSMAWWCLSTMRTNTKKNYYALKYNTILFDTIQYYLIQYNTIWYNTILFDTIQYYLIQYNTIWYNTKQYATIQYYRIQYNTIMYNTIQYYMIQYNTI